MLLRTVVAAVGTANLVAAQGVVDNQLYGTWSSKSNKTLTGPGFYDPINDKIIEPDLPGISYSFTSDGYYEEAYYRAVANPSKPSCPKGIIQWQHGSFEKTSDGRLDLTPIAVDGRQLYSDPCNYEAGVYTRYNQSQTLNYSIETDQYHNILRLNLYESDGTPIIPLYLAYKPAEMLPTTTLNPTSSATSTSSKRKIKRADEIFTPIKRKLTGQKPQHIDADRWWWFGVGMTTVGGLLYICF